MSTILRLTFVVAACGCFAATSMAQEETPPATLEDITHDMKVAANQLSKKSTDKPTQQPQSEAVSKLDGLIASLEKERQSMQGGNVGPKPTDPAMASTIPQGPGGPGELHGTRDQGDRWGELPAHERDRILQSLTEGFPPHYQAILEGYYKRLAVEKRAETAEPTIIDSKSGMKTPAPRATVMPPVKSAMPAKKAVK